MVKALSALRSQEEALARARRLVGRAEARCRELGVGLVAAYIVGSRARGDYTAHSDVDLVLVVRDVRDVNPLDRLHMFMDLLEPGVELRVYDVEEWNSDDVWARELRREAVELRPHAAATTGKHDER